MDLSVFIELNNKTIAILGFVAFFLILGVIATLIIVPIVIHQRRVKWVDNHSEAILRIKKINSQYKFFDIPNFDMTHKYDNENFYRSIGPKDYLIYELVFLQKKIKLAIHDANENFSMLEKYCAEIKNRCVLERYDSDVLIAKEKILNRLERKLIKTYYQHPITSFNVTVRLYLTNIKGAIRTGKSQTFTIEQIMKLIYRINKRSGDRFLDEDIWRSISIVERGKVSNKLRFLVYKRDNNRCVYCGSRRNLEVDHIIPIAKGGKTTLSNLQTLCHNCNIKKGSNIIE